MIVQIAAGLCRAEGRVLLAALALLWPLSSGRAQSIQQQELEEQDLAPASPAQDWDVTLGTGLRVGPSYPGAARDDVRPIPLISASYRNVLFLGSNGVRLDLIDHDGFTAGPLLGYFGGRQEGDDPHLQGLGNVEASATAGWFSTYRSGPFRATASLRQAITHAGNGLLGAAQLDYRLPSWFGDATEITIGPDLEAANARYEKIWFGVTPAQTERSGLPSYRPEGGLKDVGLHADLSYHYADHVILHGFATVQQLTDDAGNSPIVEDRTQALFGLGIGYHF